MSSSPLVIAIDGPAASGKGTIGRKIAALLGLNHLDTGLLYRAVARDVLRAGDDPHDPAVAARHAAQLDPARFDDPDLRAEEIGRFASVVAAHPAVRAALVAFQRDFARRPPGAVLDGRDIGTVICPDAPVKFFITASLDARAARRHHDATNRGEAIGLDAVREELRIRDERDSGRSTAPTRLAPDAHLIDTTHIDAETAIAAAMAHIATKRAP